MPINVMPGWIKILVLIICLAAGVWVWGGNSKRRCNQESKAYLAERGPSLEHGLPGKAKANVSQFVSNPLESAHLPGEGIMIIRDTTSNYYKDEP